MVWQPTFNGPPVASVGAPGVAPSDPKVLYAGIGENDIRSDLSLGGGVYRSSDGASRSTKPFLYQSATAIRLDHDAFPATRVPVDEPTAKNPLEGALIDYYLLTAASKITLTVYDSSKQLVRTYSSDNMQVPRQRAAVVASPWYTHKEPLATNEGMHRFEWSLNCDATGSPEADLSDAGFGGGPAPRGPHALPGIYRVKPAAASGVQPRFLQRNAKEARRRPIHAPGSIHLQMMEEGSPWDVFGGIDFS